MTDRELEQRLRAWYAAEVGETETAPGDLRESPRDDPGDDADATTCARPSARFHTPGGRRGPDRRRRAGRGFRDHAPDAGRDAKCRTSPSFPPRLRHPRPRSRPRTSAPANRSRTSEPSRRRADCLGSRPTCPTSRVWIVGSDGQGAHELFPDGLTFQGDLAWSPDGTQLLYSDEGGFYLTDANGRDPQHVDTGCAAPCVRDSQVNFSNDGRSIVFMRESNGPDGYAGPAVIATMDLATGRVVELTSTGWGGTSAPRWSPDGKRILFFRFGEGGQQRSDRTEAERGLAGRYRWPEPAAGESDRRSPPNIPSGPRTAPGSCSKSPDGEPAGSLHNPAGRDRCSSPDHGRSLDLRELGRGRTDPLRPGLGRLQEAAALWVGGRWTPMARTRPASSSNDVVGAVRG